MSIKKILVPRWVDQTNTNAQISNARAMLSRFSNPDVQWMVSHYEQADPAVAERSNVKTRKLIHNGLWRCHTVLQYQATADAIFYPGGGWFEDWGLRLRRLTGRRVPVVATLEGLLGCADREQEYSEWAKHPVYCQRVEMKTLLRMDELYRRADHVIAISPFLAEMGRRRYGDKFSVVPLGINDSIFFSPEQKQSAERTRVVSAGNLKAGKRPDMFVELAKRHPEADFVWYGGHGSQELAAFQIQTEGFGNLSFPGNLQPAELAEAFRSADLFVMPSVSEGVPKVTQEAAACGLPVVLFGYYEAHSVVDEANGYVVWDDDSFYARVAELLADAELRSRMGREGTTMAQEWSWDVIALRWEAQILEVVK